MQIKFDFSKVGPNELKNIIEYLTKKPWFEVELLLKPIIEFIPDPKPEVAPAPSEEPKSE